MKKFLLRCGIVVLVTIAGGACSTTYTADVKPDLTNEPQSKQSGKISGQYAAEIDASGAIHGGRFNLFFSSKCVFRTDLRPAFNASYSAMLNRLFKQPPTVRSVSGGLMSASTRGLIGIRAEGLEITGRCGGSSCSAKATLRTKLVGQLLDGTSLDEEFAISEDLWKINLMQICWTMEALLKELLEKVQMKSVEQVEQKIISAAQGMEGPADTSKKVSKSDPGRS